MTRACPQWLSRRNGSLKLTSDGNTWFVLIGDQPHYSLRAVPVSGKFGCVIRQTNNGQRIESEKTFSTPDEALDGGVEDLGKTLGWV